VLDTSTRLADCFAATFSDLPAEDIPRASMATVDGWDSMATITLLSLVEEEFTIRVPPEDILLFTSFDGVLNYLLGRGVTARGEMSRP
jgi:acyl carrier protein